MLPFLKKMLTKIIICFRKPLKISLPSLKLERLSTQEMMMICEVVFHQKNYEQSTEGDVFKSPPMNLKMKLKM